MKRYPVIVPSLALVIYLAVFGGLGLVYAQVKTIKADMVIIGGGGAGTAAALTAIQNGVKEVVLLEKQPDLGGTSALAGGQLWGAETHIQQAAGAKTNKDEAFKEHMEFNHFDRVDPKVLRAFIEKTADTMKWLEDNGIGYKANGYTHSPLDSTGATRNFGRTIKKLADRFTAGGGQIFLNTKAENILRGPDGRISGVIATDTKGETILINTKTVILATGGFTGNEELLYKYFPAYWDSNAYHSEATKTNTGDGIKLAADAGAGLNDYATLVREPGYTFYEGENNFNRLCNRANAWVNKHGQRFQDETWSGNGSVNALLKQPGKVGFALFDEESVQAINDSLKSRGQYTHLKEFYREEDKKGEWVKISDNWDDIARWIGADPKVLKAEVDLYNSFCDQGRDAVFAKNPKSLKSLRTPPYYAVKFGPLMIDTYGPVRINERMEILDKQDKPIPGFYAGGAICGQIQGHDYHLHGGALGFAVNSGRIAAENATKYLLGR
jgi:fumarate reductase flavoprotein subunit